MKNISVRVTDDKYLISFPYDLDAINWVKTLAGRRWVQSEKHWTASRDLPNARIMHVDGVFTDEPLLNLLSIRPQKGDDHDWCVTATLFKHQIEFSDWCVMKPRIMLIGEPGVGKTLMSMLWLKRHFVHPKNVLIVCPLSLCGNWREELQRFTGETAHIIHGTKKDKERALSQQGIHIINYEGMVKIKTNDPRPEVVALNKTTLIMDEAHQMKVSSSTRSKVMWKYAKSLQNCIGLTGTPVSQGPHDYFSQFRILDDRLLGAGFSAFKTRYCEISPIYGVPHATKITGYKNLDELNQIIAPYTFTVRKKDCLDLPEKQYQVIHTELSDQQQAAYAEIKDEMILELEGGTITAQNILTRLVKLQQITQGFIMTSEKPPRTLRFKDNAKLDVVLDLILGSTDHVIIVCKFRDDVQVLSEAMVKHGILHQKIYGDVDPVNRQGIVNAFQQGVFRVLIGQIQTIGTGFNLTAASRMIFFSNTFSHVEREQAEDRLHRIGQRATCQYIDVVARGTIDEKILEALRSKKDMAQQMQEMRMSASFIKTL